MSVQNSKGFSILELLAVIVIVGVIAGVGISRSFPSTALHMQAARDLLLISVLQAQQRALAQDAGVALITAARSIDIRRDKNHDQNFAGDESETFIGGAYPVTLPGGVTVSAEEIRFDRLGHTQATELTLRKGGQSLTVRISGAGYAN